MDKKSSMMASRLQSAMEYLMTYGWSILIVAVVLGALAYLGVFNPLYFAPKANPGSCQAFRPNGAGTSYDINLLGVCNGEMPQYVASFNGGTSYVNVISSGFISPSAQISNFAWIDLSATGSAIIEKQGSYGMKVGVQGAMPGQFAGYVWGTNGVCGTFPFTLSLGRWYFVGFTFDGTYLKEYVDGSLYCSITYQESIPQSGNPLALGGPGDADGYVRGMISNVQLYNTSLDSNSVFALYQEGIGGAPIDLQNLVGWWPLNGNANDYSGNGGDGAAVNVVYTNSWTSSYMPH